MDDKKKKKYDSTLDFNDEIPTEPINKDTFFEEFSEVFFRNSLWSKKQPVPIFGDKNSSYV